MNTITFCLEDDNNAEINFNGETLTFTLQMFKIYSIQRSLQKFKSDSYCVGGRHRSGTKNIYGNVTNEGTKVLVVYCSISSCNRKLSKTVYDSTIQVERLSSFFKMLGRISAKAGKKLATDVLKNPCKALEITTNIATAAATKIPKAALSTLPEVFKFYHTGNGLYLGNFV